MRERSLEESLKGSRTITMGSAHETEEPEGLTHHKYGQRPYEKIDISWVHLNVYTHLYSELKKKELCKESVSSAKLNLQEELIKNSVTMTVAHPTTTK